MSFFDYLKNTFLQPRMPEDRQEAEIALNIHFKIEVVEFADNVESRSGETIARLLRTQDGLDVSYFEEPFSKTFLNLESRTLFDLIDRGQTILDKTGADVLIWGYREADKIRLNFQTSLQYEKKGNSFVSLMDSLFLPAQIFENIDAFPSSIVTLIYGAVISALNTTNKPQKIQKRFLLKKIISKLTADNSAKSLSIDYLPYIMNFLGIIYLSCCADDEKDKDFKIVKNLFETAIKHQDLIKNPIHLGCIYNHFGQLYSCTAHCADKRPAAHFKNAISSYRQAQKYLSKYNYPYDYGLISYKLAQLYYDYWRQKEDLQALRDAVFNLREAEKVFTYALFPEFWADIQGDLGYMLSLLGNLTGSSEISSLAVTSYKNQQKIITERRDPLAWAQIQEYIGDIYYRTGKNIGNKEALEDSLEYYHDALYIYENMEHIEDGRRLTTDIAKASHELSFLSE